jgi:hypothetical protein
MHVTRGGVGDEAADAIPTPPPSHAVAVQGRAGPPTPTAAPQDSMLRSMLLVMAERVREVHEENERLHESIAHMYDWQKKTTRKLTALEVESHVRIRSLEQAHAEMAQRWRHSIDQLEMNSAEAFGTHATHNHPMLRHAFMSTSASSIELPLSPAVESRYISREVAEIIERSLPFLRRFLSPSLIIKDHRYSSQSLAAGSRLLSSAQSGSQDLRPARPKQNAVGVDASESARDAG